MKKVALVTGGSGDIGSEISYALAEEGIDVAVHYFRDKEDALKVEKKIKDLGMDCLVIQADVSRYDDVKRMRDEIINHFGKIDILVNNAGINKDALLSKMEHDMWKEVMDVNLGGAFNCIKAMVEDVAKSGNGAIINISSVVGVMGNIGQVNYAASKAGLIGLTKTLALELSSKNITVNAIAPGFIKSQMINKIPDHVKEKIINKIPLKRFGEPWEVGKIVAYLASDNARYITGTVININGGLYI
ncbi:MAG: 3-oxoacyl-[acyl-carrier-protein] reductase [Thermoplasmata archaeon]